jgi:hypothetical protein
MVSGIAAVLREWPSIERMVHSFLEESGKNVSRFTKLDEEAENKLELS